MEEKIWLILLIAFLITFLAIGIPYWQTPYSQLSLPHSIYGFGLVLLFTIAAILRCASKASLSQSFMVVGLSVPAMALVRVAVDLFEDPTSHNLWSFEIIVATGLGIGVAFAGTLLGSLLAFIFRKLTGKKKKSS